MLRSIEGVYSNGKIEFLESPPSHIEGKVIVTFLNAVPVDLRRLGIDESQAAEMRRGLTSIADDWDRPEMDAYDAV